MIPILQPAILIVLRIRLRGQLSAHKTFFFNYYFWERAERILLFFFFCIILYCSDIFFRSFTIYKEFFFLFLSCGSVVIFCPNSTVNKTWYFSQNKLMIPFFCFLNVNELEGGFDDFNHFN